MLKLTKELVVNWHITEACNYKCDYCFAKWDSNSKEVLHSPIKIETLIEQIDNIRHVLNKSNKNVYFDQLRLNLVGGETFLYGKQLKNIINLAKKSLYTTNFTEPLSYQGSAFLKLPKFP
jgi:radical S-adenosyl methionine domain-containing protein 2